MKNLISEKLDESNKMGRGFVYLAWKSKPEAYFYVGKAGSSKRVNVDSHGKLLESLKKASYFTLVFPSKSTRENLSNLEAAIINLIEYRIGDVPEENSRRERFILEYECGEELLKIRKLMSQIQRALTR